MYNVEQTKNMLKVKIGLIYDLESYMQYRCTINHLLDILDSDLKNTLIGAVKANGLIEKDKIKDFEAYQKAKKEYYKYFDLYRKFNSMYNKLYAKEQIKKYGMHNIPKEKNNYLGLSLLTN